MAGEGREFGPDRRKIRVCHVHQPLGERHSEVSTAQGRHMTVGGEEVNINKVVPGAAISQRARPAGVIADHPADSATC